MLFVLHSDRCKANTQGLLKGICSQKAKVLGPTAVLVVPKTFCYWGWSFMKTSESLVEFSLHLTHLSVTYFGVDFVWTGYATVCCKVCYNASKVVLGYTGSKYLKIKSKNKKKTAHLHLVYLMVGCKQWNTGTFRWDEDNLSLGKPENCCANLWTSAALLNTCINIIHTPYLFLR